MKNKWANNERRMNARMRPASPASTKQNFFIKNWVFSMNLHLWQLTIKVVEKERVQPLERRNHTVNEIIKRSNHWYESFLLDDRRMLVSCDHNIKSYVLVLYDRRMLASYARLLCNRPQTGDEKMRCVSPWWQNLTQCVVTCQSRFFPPWATMKPCCISSLLSWLSLLIKRDCADCDQMM